MPEPGIERPMRTPQDKSHSGMAAVTGKSQVTVEFDPTSSALTC